LAKPIQRAGANGYSSDGGLRSTSKPTHSAFQSAGSRPIAKRAAGAYSDGAPVSSQTRTVHQTCSRERSGVPPYSIP
jgi:hypothetical protein